MTSYKPQQVGDINDFAPGAIELNLLQQATSGALPINVLDTYETALANGRLASQQMRQQANAATLKENALLRNLELQKSILGNMQNLAPHMANIGSYANASIGNPFVNPNQQTLMDDAASRMTLIENVLKASKANEADADAMLSRMKSGFTIGEGTPLNKVNSGNTIYNLGNSLGAMNAAGAPMKTVNTQDLGNIARTGVVSKVTEKTKVDTGKPTNKPLSYEARNVPDKHYVGELNPTTGLVDIYQRNGQMLIYQRSDKPKSTSNK